MGSFTVGYVCGVLVMLALGLAMHYSSADEDQNNEPPRAPA